jgi:hypothetical protein
VEASTTPAKQQTVATEQESVQAEQKDITQLYIGQNIIVKGLESVGSGISGVVIVQPIGRLVGVELVYWAAIMFIRVIQGSSRGLASETRCKRQPRVCTEHFYVILSL